MPIEQQPFRRTRLDEDRAQDKSRILRVRLTQEEAKVFEEAARIIGQEKASTALKQLAELGSAVLQGHEKKVFADILFNNARRNYRLGIVEAQPKFWQM